MIQRALVTRRLDRDRVEVRVQRLSACSHDCDNCAGCGSMVYQPKLTAVAQDPLGAEVGQYVAVETASSRLLKMAALLYLLPFVALFAVYLLLGNASEGVAALGGVGAFVAVLLGVCIPLDRHLRRHNITLRVVGLGKS